MSELADTLAAFAELDLGGAYASAAAEMLRSRLDLGAPTERERALALIARLEAKSAPLGVGVFPGACATAL